jgi:hypothetical protein
MALAPTSCPAASPVIVFLASLGAAGCAIVRVPPHAAQSRFGVVHAVDSQTAREYAKLLDRVGTVGSQALPGLAVEPVDVRIAFQLPARTLCCPP